MKPIKLLNNYHDSQLESFSIGPRNEVTLNIHLDREGAPEITKVRFGAIKNFQEVQLFFSYFPNNLTEHYICEINKIENTSKNNWIINFDRYGTINIQSAKFIEK